MANISLILGKQGSGKTTSIENLDPESTIIISLTGKRMPFEGSTKVWNTENKNYFQLEDSVSILNLLKNINNSAPHIKTIVFDDHTYLMRKEYFARAKETSFNKFVEIAQHFQQIISYCEKMREEINIFFLMHPEEIVSNNVIVGYKVATIGKMIDDKYNPLEVVTTVLFAEPKYKEDGSIEYGFYTNAISIDGIKLPSKSPKGLFPDIFIPNDLRLVVDRMDEYF